MSSETYSLQDLRHLYLLTEGRVQALQLALQNLQAQEVWFNLEKTLVKIKTALEVNFDDPYDVDEKLAAEREAMGSLPQKTEEGVAWVLVNPFQENCASFSGWMGGYFDYLSTSAAHLQKLARRPLHDQTEVQRAFEMNVDTLGLAASELQVLERHYTAKVLGNLSAIRQFRTALHYLETALARGVLNEPLVLANPGVPEAVRVLTQVADIPGFEPAATHFSSSSSWSEGSDDINIIRALPVDKDSFMKNMALVPGPEVS